METSNDAEDVSAGERAVHEQALAAAAGLRLPAPTGGAALTMRTADQRAARRRAIGGGGVALAVAAAIGFATLRVGRGATDLQSPSPSTSAAPTSTAPTSTAPTSAPSAAALSPERVVAAFRLPAELLRTSNEFERIRTAGVTLFDGCLTAVMRTFRSEWSRAPSTLRKLPGLKVDDVYSMHSDEIRGAPGRTGRGRRPCACSRRRSAPGPDLSSLAIRSLHRSRGCRHR
jgi:hypothetical protein